MSNSEKEIHVKLEDMDEFFKWFFITSTTLGQNNEEVSEFVNKVVDGGIRDDEGNLTGEQKIRMFVNDIEVNPYEALGELQKQFNNVVNKRIRNIFESELDQKLSELTFSIENIKEEIINKKEEYLKKYQ